jgi:hypothetical protein
MNTPIHWLVALALVGGTAVGWDRCQREGDTMDVLQINSRYYGDEQNSSCLPFASRYSGTTVRDITAELDGEPRAPVHLAIHGSLLLVSYGDALEARSRADGSLVWKRPFPASGQFDLKPEGAVCVDPIGNYRILKPDGTSTDPLLLPFLHERTRFFVSDMRGGEIRYCYETIPTPTNSPSDPTGGPLFTFMRLTVPARKIVWMYEQKEYPIGVLVDPGKTAFFVLTPTQIHIIPLGTESESAVRKIPVREAQCFSMDPAGHLLIVEREEKHHSLVLRAVDQQGAPQWEVPLGEEGDFIRPPATTPAGYVYVVVSNQLICLEPGAISWKRSMPKKAEQVFLTVLTDGSVIAAAGTALYHIGGAGNDIRTMFLPSVITCRPLVDDRGDVYVGMMGKIVEMK